VKQSRKNIEAVASDENIFAARKKNVKKITNSGYLRSNKMRFL